MNAEILVMLKDTLADIHVMALPDLAKEDLYGSIKECIYYFESTYDKKDQKMARVLDYLYQIKKIRNEQAHASKIISDEEELKQLLVIKSFLHIIKEQQYLNYKAKSVDEYLNKLNVICEELGRKIYANNIKQDNRDDARTFPLTDSFALALEKIARINSLVWNIHFALTEEDFPINKKPDKMLSYPKNDAIIDINNYLENNSNAKASKELIDNYVELGTELVEEWLCDIIDIFNSKKNTDTAIVEQNRYILGEKEYEKKKKRLIELRERMISETNVPRECLILRKSVLEKIIRYNVNTYEKYSTYIEDLVPKYKAEQEKYLLEVFDIINSKEIG